MINCLPLFSSLWIVLSCKWIGTSALRTLPVSSLLVVEETTLRSPPLKSMPKFFCPRIAKAAMLSRMIVMDATMQYFALPMKSKRGFSKKCIIVMRWRPYLSTAHMKPVRVAISAENSAEMMPSVSATAKPFTGPAA